MQLKNLQYSIDIEIDNTFTLESTDNRPYDYIFNPEALTRNDYTKVFSIRISKGCDEPTNIALIGSFYSFPEDCAILKDNHLTVLMDSTITVIDLITLSIIRHKIFSDFGTYFSIYSFDNGYIVYGELDIVKLDITLQIEWTFSGADIFVLPDESIIPFNINGDTIELRDWEGKYYYLDKYGNKIS